MGRTKKGRSPLRTNPSSCSSAGPVEISIGPLVRAQPGRGEV